MLHVARLYPLPFRPGLKLDASGLRRSSLRCLLPDAPTCTRPAPPPVHLPDPPTHPPTHETHLFHPRAPRAEPHSLPPFDLPSYYPLPPDPVRFPSEDEACGCVSLAWRGPPYADRGGWIGLQLLWRYLTDSAASPLQKVRATLGLLPTWPRRPYVFSSPGVLSPSRAPLRYPLSSFNGLTRPHPHSRRCEQLLGPRIADVKSAPA
jgi:hypothetical protein